MTGLNDEMLKKELFTFTMKELQILISKSEGEESQSQISNTEEQIPLSKQKSVKVKISKTQVFRVNGNFKSKLKRITINSLQKKETK